MRVTSKGQITIPLNVRKSMGILPAETEVEFMQDPSGKWYIVKFSQAKASNSRFRTAHLKGKLLLNTDEIMALTRGDSWPSS
jgi:bifunctional DNA-binding transcriptional regulator/antitoxin component of YhaV-PrlF toxin-antitoxin module